MIKRARRLGRAGYTLAEMMIVVAIIGILALVGPPLMINMQNFFLMTSARFEIQRDARNSLDIVNRFLRQAYQSSIVIDTLGGEGPYSHITFQLPDGRVMQFQQKGTQLIQTVTPAGGGTNSSITLSNNLIFIAFTFPHTDDTSIVSVAITMGKSIQLGQRKVLELTVQKVRVMN